MPLVSGGVSHARAGSLRRQVLREVRRVVEAGFGVYGFRRVWRQVKRARIVRRSRTVARLMKSIGLNGAVR